ncbi:MAG: archaemetzincin [Candidatus Hodarchaeota archaeon]
MINSIESSSQPPLTVEELVFLIKKLRPLHKPLDNPKPGDWLYHYEESGQTFEDYLNCIPRRPQGRRRIIYILPLGNFTEKQRMIINLTADFMNQYFNLGVKIQENLPLRNIPQSTQRIHPTWGDKQILTTYILDKILLRKRPKDAAAYIAFTTSDLWPGEGWNFCFGEAKIRKRVGVWSIYRNGDPDRNEETFRTCLLRTIKTATHETGHIFTMLHCIMYKCNMGGSNSQAEVDRQPLALCPECLAKLCWATGAKPIERFQHLKDFCDKYGLKKEALFYKKSIEILK